ncbi:integration host factor subunit beta [Rhizobium bangladeshense]|uniref:integration host factor subunit beta n=1 Tax=Rhizobium bangladeshense TaxID=1138189 RepID=UPI001C836D14|nr:integration host factor subunit beta [Rhizobium bangladeshense]MBX4898868.1 integration host factor subunit beta [Rhizobium bangladeshense]MBY3616964.1 integration host factor subunit beta [Rhizobium bangladeshense]
MIKSELVSLIESRNPQLYHNDAERIVDTSLDEIAETLAQGGRVDLLGFGVFSVRNRPSRSGRNPSNGTSVFVEEKWVPFFGAGKEMQDRLNPSHEE